MKGDIIIPLDFLLAIFIASGLLGSRNMLQYGREESSHSRFAGYAFS